jgi:hypothetical protein
LPLRELEQLEEALIVRATNEVSMCCAGPHASPSAVLGVVVVKAQAQVA